jgi:predicted glutamine amidotransferase
MCRLLYAKSEKPFEVEPFLQRFAKVAKNSPEYQGHGWGLALWDGAQWKSHHSIQPIWEDALPNLGTTTCLIAHARSAFRDEGICVENNMPFLADNLVFAFNGELHEVRIRAEGRIGAEKIFNFLRTQHEGDWMETISSGARAIRSRAKRIRAMNFLVANEHRAYCYSAFDEKPDYFQMHVRNGPIRVLCSQPFEGEQGWEPAPVNQAFWM